MPNVRGLIVGCWKLLRTAASEWSNHTSQMGAALAFYAVFTIAPILVISLHLIGWIYGPDAAESRLDMQIQQYVGPVAATAIQSMIVAVSQPQAGFIENSLSWMALLFGASGMFVQMQEALNFTWNLPPSPNRSFWKLIIDRLLAFLMIFVIATLMFALVVFDAILSAISKNASAAIPEFLAFVRPLNEFGSIVIFTLLFAMIFKYLPEVRITWNDVWFGAIVTALLFALGKYVMSFYLATAAVNSAYGAAGSIAVILVWAYYSSQILFFGAEVTQAYAVRFGSLSQREKQSTAM